MFLVLLVATSIVLVVKAIDTASVVILSSYASVYLYPLTLSAIKLKINLISIIRKYLIIGGKRGIKDTIR